MLGSLSVAQVASIDMIIQKWNNSKLTDKRWLAYILATTYHETAGTMLPVKEYGRGKGRAYGIPDKVTGLVYYGRGFVQLTWKSNYKTMGDLLGVDLVNQPDLALRPDIAAEIMFEGMTTGKSFRGDFTGRHLGQYFNATTEDPVGARRIINGQDKAKLIAEYYSTFIKSLS